MHPILSLLLAFLVRAHAADAPPGETITVEAERAARARAALEHRLEQAEYYRWKREGQLWIYRSPVGWKPDALVSDDGWLTFRRQTPSIFGPVRQWNDVVAVQRSTEVLALGVPETQEEADTIARAAGLGRLCFGTANIPTGTAGMAHREGKEIIPGDPLARKAYSFACASIAGYTVSQKRVNAARSELLAQVAQPVRDLNDAVAAEAQLQRLNVDVPATLYAIWGDVSATALARRAELFRWWDDRTDTPEGDAAKDAARAFLIGVVQSSDEPYTQAELDALNAARVSTRALSLPVGEGVETPPKGPRGQ